MTAETRDLPVERDPDDRPLRRCTLPSCRVQTREDICWLCGTHIPRDDLHP